jgi:diguanylate cyclase
LCGDDVAWCFEAELISALFLTVIWAYSHEKNRIPTLKNGIFRGCMILTYSSIIIDILCAVLLMTAVSSKALPLLIGTTLHYIVVPMNTALIQIYMLAVIREETGQSAKNYIRFSLVPFLAFFILILSNVVTGAVFMVTPAGVIILGPLFWLCYAIHYLYCLIMFLTLCRNRKIIPNDIRKVLFIIPALIVAFVLLQQMLSSMILSGIAAVSVILITYLYLQNKRIYEDQLTGLPNRSAYIRMIQFLIEKKRTMVVVVISLNDFRFINDKFGQSNGDLLLKSVANYIKGAVPLAGVYRCGGDEFAVIFDKHRPESVGSYICILSDRFTRPWDIPGCTCHLGAAIGVAHCPATADSRRELISMLESAVDRAKASGSTQPVFCDRDIINRVRRKHHIKELLSVALKNDGFEIYYQPLYSIQDRRFFEAEALLRLKDEDGRFLSPEEFIPVAEETGLIVNIGYAVIDKVCQYIRFLLKCGIEIDTISVNLSVVQLMKPDIVPHLLQIIRGNGISPSRIVFEITESALVTNFEVAAEKIRKLSEAGIRFALDDFGTGYSNLTHVIDLPFHMIKIDKSLIWDSMTNQKCYILIRDITRTFKNMNLLVIAEGVETQEHDAFVRLCGCDRIQGFLYARPMPVSQVSDYLGRELSESK